MKRLRAVLRLLALLALLSFLTQGQTEALRGTEILKGSWKGHTIEYLDRDILVGLRPGTSQDEFINELGSIGVEIARPADRTGFLKVRVASGADLLEIIDNIARLSTVRYAEPNLVDRMHVLPNDPEFGRQWHYHNTGHVPPGGSPDADVDAPEGWDITTGSTAIKVGVLDSGIPISWAGVLSHPDLDDSTGFLFGYDFVNNDMKPSDDNGHGTHVTGTIAAETNNGEGVRVLTYRRLQNMMALVLAVSYFTMAYLGRRVKLKAISGLLLKVSRRIFGVPEFRYCALADGIRELLLRNNKGPIRPTQRNTPQYQFSLFNP